MRISSSCGFPPAWLWVFVAVLVTATQTPAFAQLRLAQAAAAPVVTSSRAPASQSAPLFQRQEEKIQKPLAAKKTEAPAVSYRTVPVQESEKPRDLNAPIVGSQNTEFFSANSASTIFQDKVKFNKKPEIQFFNARYMPPKEDDAEAVKSVPGSEQSPEQGKPKLESANDILKAFGAPTEDDKILALDNAPDSFKGMMAALQIGDENLAYQYARRYARRVREFKNRTMVGLGMIGKGMESEGMLAKSDWASNPMFADQQRLAEQNDLQTAQAQEDTRIARLDPQTREFLRKAEEAEEMGDTPGKKPAMEQKPQLSEPEERAQVRRLLTGKLPVDPKGELQIFFFFRLYDVASLEAVPNIEAFYRSVAKEGGTNFLATSLDETSAGEIDGFRTQTNTTFPVKNAARLAKEFGIKAVPMVVFVSPNTGKAVFEEGKRSFAYLDEVARMMKGK